MAVCNSFLYHLENDDFSSLALRASNAPAIAGVANSVENRFIIYRDALYQIDAHKGALPYYRSLAERFPEWRDEINAAVQALNDCASYGDFLLSRGFTFDEAGYLSECKLM